MTRFDMLAEILLRALARAHAAAEAPPSAMPDVPSASKGRRAAGNPRKNTKGTKNQ